MVGKIVIDDANQKWIQVPQGNGVYVFNHGSSIDNTGDNHWKWFARAEVMVTCRVMW